MYINVIFCLCIYLRSIKNWILPDAWTDQVRHTMTISIKINGYMDTIGISVDPYHG